MSSFSFSMYSTHTDATGNAGFSPAVILQGGDTLQHKYVFMLSGEDTRHHNMGPGYSAS